MRKPSTITIDFAEKTAGLAAAIETTSGERRERLEKMLAATIKRLVADFADEVMFCLAAELGTFKTDRAAMAAIIDAAKRPLAAAA